MEGKERFGYFRLGRHSGFSKVTRRKGGTDIPEHTDAGYVHNPKPPPNSCRYFIGVFPH
jgi:hypothetical protein